VRIKVCGLTEPEHVDAAVEAGVDAIGLVLVPSVRQVSVDLAARLLERVPPHIERFAVFRVPDTATVAAIASLPFTVLQGDAVYTGPVPEGWRYVSTYRNDASVLERLVTQEAGLSWTDGLVLVDGPGEAGEGVTGNWARARSMAERVPLMLAGGLSPDNVVGAIRAVMPFAVDVSSGVESARGVKDVQRIVQFVRVVRDECHQG
jgi:phosphoribosylanthranilate isomerase